MAMMIGKFHKMIQSKVVWFIVLGVIVVTFVFWGVGAKVGNGGGQGQQQAGQVIATLFGEDVSMEEYRQAMMGTRLWYMMTTGRVPGQDRATAQALEEQAWVRLAMLHKTAEEGVLVSDQEVKDLILQLPIFRGQNGAFNEAAYKGILAQMGVTPGQAEVVVREQLAMRKLAVGPLQAALITPAELEQAYHMVSDRLVLEYAVLPRSSVEESVSVTREEAVEYFEANREDFRMPARASVSYVEFPVADYLDQVEMPEGLALQLYNENIEYYRVESTNENAAVEYKLFEDVEGEINEMILEKLARDKAVEAATALVADVAPKGQSAKPDFRGAVAAASLTAKTLPAFGPYEKLDGIDETAPFQRVALSLRDNSYDSYSDAVAGKETVYVMSLVKRDESFLPEFEQVEERVMDAARRSAVNEALAQRALDIQETVPVVLETGKSFADAMAPLDLTVEMTDEFSQSDSLDHDYAQQMMAVAMNAKEGELCSPVPVANGVLFVYVSKRIAADAELGLAAVRDVLLEQLSNERAQRLGASWQTALMNEADRQMK